MLSAQNNWFRLRELNKSDSLVQDSRPVIPEGLRYEGWNFNSGNYLFTTDTK